MVRKISFVLYVLKIIFVFQTAWIRLTEKYKFIVRFASTEWKIKPKKTNELKEAFFCTEFSQTYPVSVRCHQLENNKLIYVKKHYCAFIFFKFILRCYNKWKCCNFHVSTKAKTMAWFFFCVEKKYIPWLHTTNLVQHSICIFFFSFFIINPVTFYTNHIVISLRIWFLCHENAFNNGNNWMMYSV